MKLVVDGSTERVVGAHILAHEAGEMIQFLAVAIKMGATKADFDATMAVHPTAAEELVTMRSAHARFRGRDGDPLKRPRTRFTRANDFSGLTALSRNSATSRDRDFPSRLGREISSQLVGRKPIRRPGLGQTSRQSQRRRLR